MAFTVQLTPLWVDQGWKAKIRDRERVEPPHVSIIRGRQTWRLCLRDGQFLDSQPKPNEVPDALLAEIRDQFDRLQLEWDNMYPENPVRFVEESND